MKSFTTLLSLLAVLLLSFGQHSYAQAPAWQMAVAATGVNSTVAGSQVSATATDASGNVYVGGSFYGALTLGNVSLASSSTGYPGDGFVAKFLPATNTFAWVVRIASPARAVSNGAFSTQVTSLYASGGSVYVGGSFSEPSATFGSTTLTNTGNTGTTEGFVARLTDAGTSASFAWAQRLGGTGNGGVNGVVVNGSSVYATGTFSGTTTDFGPTALTSAGGTDSYVIKLTDAGTSASVAWTQRLGGPGNDAGTEVEFSGSSVYVAGNFQNAVAFGSTTLTSAGGTDGFVAKLTDAGSTVSVGWAQGFGGAGDEAVQDLINNGSQLYAIGYFQNAVAFGSTTLTSAGGYDGFVTKLTDAGSTGSFTWANRFGGPNGDFPVRLAVNGGGKLYVTGEFGYTGSSAAGSGTFGSTTLQSGGNGDVFITKLVDRGSTGTFDWVQQASSSAGDAGFAVALSGTRVYVGGIFIGATSAFGSTTLTNPRTNGTASCGFFGSLADLTLPTRAASLPEALRLSPNPAHASVAVPVPDAPGVTTATLTLTDALGRTVRTARPAPGSDYALDLMGLAPGVYLVQVLAGETLAAQRLVVE